MAKKQQDTFAPKYRVEKPEALDTLSFSPKGVLDLNQLSVAQIAALQSPVTLQRKPGDLRSRKLLRVRPPHDVIASEEAPPRPAQQQQQQQQQEGPQPSGAMEGGDIFESGAGGLTEIDLNSVTPGPEKRAVWIVHGMGQQIPFETVDSLTEGILNVARRNPANADVRPTAQAVKIGEQTLQRVVLKLAGLDQEKNTEYELHLYEAYWAPLTEGVANLKDVISFLLNGGLRGLLNSTKRFKMAMFDRICKFRVPVRTAAYLLLTLGVLASLIVLNAVIVAASSAQLNLFSKVISINDDQWGLLASFGTSVSAIAISFGAVLFLAGMCKGPKQRPWQRVWLGFFSWVGTGLTLIAFMTCAVFFLRVVFRDDELDTYTLGMRLDLQGGSTALILLALGVIGLAMIVRAVLRSNRERTPAFQDSIALNMLLVATFLVHLAAIALPVAIYFGWTSSEQLAPYLSSVWLSSEWWVWPSLGFVSAQVRTLLLEYVGDVAIYVAENKVDRFYATREQIKKVALDSASAVYLAKDKWTHGPEYKQVAIVGHSLGSVIAFDTLNRLINDDELSGCAVGVAERTCLFETFGSPLDKIAFLYTIQGTDSFQIRGQLVEAVRPMIQSYDFRKFPWVNVRSRNDIISGKLMFYDLPADANACDCVDPDATPGMPAGAKRAEDVIDKDASVALMAHVEYWKNETVWEELMKRVAP